MAFALGGCASTPPTAKSDAARDATADPYISAPDAVTRAQSAPTRNVAGIFELTVRSVVVRDGIVLLDSENDPRKPDLLVVEVMPSAQREILARTHHSAARYFRNKHITVQGVARRVVMGPPGKNAAARYGTRVQMDHFAQVLTILD
ncbi:hypothetical protein [Solilutibacter silvestris]|uniref:hypothetical protein n=1 Tax=Solilutibacter silvestris TaxID=1645665 RepID=UPI000CA08380|nr:hypothetical protein [Lysobacter silvestris]